MATAWKTSIQNSTLNGFKYFTIILLVQVMLCNVNIQLPWPKSRIIRSNKKSQLIILVEGLELNDEILMHVTFKLNIADVDTPLH